MTHTVDVRGRKVEALRSLEAAGARLAAERQALLANGATDDRDCAAGAIVVVEARVVVLHPADQPGGQVRVAQQLLIGALGGVVADVVDPQLRTVCKLADECLELGSVEVPPTWPGHVVERLRPEGGCGEAPSAATPDGSPSAPTVTSQPRSQATLP